MPAIYLDKLLERTATPDQLDRQRAASTRRWDAAYLKTDAGRKAADAVAFQRHDQTVRHVVPWVAKHVDIAGMKVLDFGSGCGSSALAFSHFARSVVGFEIDHGSVEAAHERMCIFEAHNVSIALADPDHIMDAALTEVDGNTVVLLCAVVEHLLERERIDYLKRFWDRLPPGGIIAVVETPNIYACLDTHTFNKPWAHLVPDAYFAEWIRRSPADLRFREEFSHAADHNCGTLLEMRRRFGLAVGPECFEMAFECDLNEIVVADRFDPEMQAWFPMSDDDRLVLATFCAHGIDLPVGFAGCVLNFIFRKPCSAKDAAGVTAWNAKRRHEIVTREMWGAPAPPPPPRGPITPKDIARWTWRRTKRLLGGVF